MIKKHRNTHFLRNLFGLFIFLISTNNAFACEDVYPNKKTVIKTYRDTGCVDIKLANPNKTYFVADSSIKKDGAYRITIKNSSGTTILNEDISYSANQFTVAEKLNTLQHSDFTISLEPLTTLTDYTYTVIHDSNLESSVSTIYIGLQTVKSNASVEPPFPQNLMMMSTSSTSTTGTIGEVAQCNAGNRPPTLPPRARSNGAPLNINSVLRVTRDWTAKINNELIHQDAAIAAIVARGYAMHNFGGALDVAHSSQSDYVGTSSMGNFLYGANLRAMGMSADAIIRLSAGTQSLPSKGWFQGAVDFVNNSGDNPGDPLEVMRGINYYDEVFSNNQNDSSHASCIDDQSIANDSTLNDASNDETSSGSGGGGGEGSGDLGDPDPDMGGGSGGGGGSGTGWCFVQAGHPTYCWTE
ncbi:hypothetical protein J8L70_01485 [Pseudoalteromonas sp. MMG010]|uniref:polymorphic toxin type 44 domain-containing protein n=1 Tax=Pseudoalteromonas sp. MMG010 TaxID=2822685 RepID=UPI001B3A74A4|nr:polymorphic toxin type 44 domain-containing protein [Pseudoalteromonas sp. MMG010]MBQ4831903.1 hypothetical protein [Pseudoalteromonas sp. MMG010]